MNNWEEFHKILGVWIASLDHRKDLIEVVEALVREETQACLDLVLNVKKQCQEKGTPTRVMICARIADDIEKRLG